ncbi:MAG: calcium:proton antiporter [Burkholderiales bacterium]
MKAALAHWTVAVPAASALLLVAALYLPPNPVLTVACIAALMIVVVAAVHHAEVVAHRVGEPFGTLVLALAITVIEVALVVSMMLAGGPEKAALARDSVYAAVMIICSGVIGACLLAGALRHREQSFRIEGAGPALAALVTLATMVLILPVFTTSAAGPRYSKAQLTFTAVASLALWAVFVFVQTVRHRDYFLPPEAAQDESAHAAPPTLGQAWMSFALLFVSLVAVVGLAKVLSPAIDAAVEAVGAPPAVIGVAIAALVLLPEAYAAVRAALANRLQTSMNLALGSALACIGLTIPAVAVASVLLDLPLVLGLEPKDLVLLMLAFVVSTITLGSGRTNLMQGAVHLVIFAAFLFLTLVP